MQPLPLRVVIPVPTTFPAAEKVAALQERPTLLGPLPPTHPEILAGSDAVGLFIVAPKVTVLVVVGLQLIAHSTPDATPPDAPLSPLTLMAPVVLRTLAGFVELKTTPLTLFAFPKGTLPAMLIVPEVVTI